MVSGGFTQVIGRWSPSSGIDHLAANVLAVEDGVVTGELDGPISTGPGRPAALRRFARRPACR